ncbi:MAG: hypothetical protein Q8P53_00765 [Candidatus Shapirobacteria bacterium]|nr:hypothetical protein [Candidatus Shapirobacteria bacterium]
MRIGKKQKGKGKKKSFSLAELKTMLVILVLFSAAMATFAWFQTSSKVFNEFDTTCQHFGYNDCMRFYWYQLGYYKNVFNIFLGLGILGTISFILLTIFPAGKFLKKIVS